MSSNVSITQQVQEMQISCSSTNTQPVAIVPKKTTGSGKSGRPTLETAWGDTGLCVKCKTYNATYGVKTDKPTHCSKCQIKGTHVYLMDRCPCSETRGRITWGAQGDEKATRCGKCKLKSDVCFTKPKCVVCKAKPPKYGPSDSKLVKRCDDCKLKTDVNNKNPKCMCKEGEGKDRVRKCWGKKGTKTALRCKYCKKEDDVEVTNRHCKCEHRLRTSYGPPGGKPVRCIYCMIDGDINILMLRFLCPCNKGDKPYIKVWGPRDCSKPIRCKNCKLPDDVNLWDKKCQCGSGIQPSYGHVGTGRFACSKCKDDSMVGVSHAICKGLVEEKLPCPFLNRANYYYEGYCTQCYLRNFPTTEKALNIRKNTWELKVRDFLIKAFPDISFVHNKSLYVGPECDCDHKRRIDLRYHLNDTILAIEVDEHQHKDRDEEDEKNRYDDLYMVYSGKIIFIRFNPHPFRKNGSFLNLPFESRLSMLEDEINLHLQRITQGENTEPVEVHYLFYDENDNSMTLVIDSDSEDIDSDSE